jgi:predicted nuclease of restriction endonuclease-like (RecB) superfamily
VKTQPFSKVRKNEQQKMTQGKNRQIIRNSDYSAFMKDVKQRIQTAQIKAAVRVNQELLGLYWDLGEQIIEKQREAKWGDGFLEQMSRDLLDEFPEMKGFSFRNLKHVRQWVEFWIPIGKQLVSQLTKQPASQLDSVEFVRQLVAQIPWGHNILIFQKIKNHDEALFYVRKTIENNWSRAVLTHQIESGLYQRDGKAISNFESTLPAPQSDLAIQTLKDPYNFDFLMLRERHDERELENALIDHVTKFLLELGAGFSYVGRQFPMEVGGDEFFIDLLFYHVRLHCYVVVELKTDKFKPEFAGKLNFYVSAVDGELKDEQDNPTIGILICKSKNDTVVEYSLKDVNKPIGVSEYQITKSLPEELKSSLPSIEEIEAEVSRIEEGADA